MAREARLARLSLDGHTILLPFLQICEIDGRLLVKGLSKPAVIIATHKNIPGLAIVSEAQKFFFSSQNWSHYFEWLWRLYVEAFEDLQKGKEEDMFFAGSICRPACLPAALCKKKWLLHLLQKTKSRNWSKAKSIERFAAGKTRQHDYHLLDMLPCSPSCRSVRRMDCARLWRILIVIHQHLLLVHDVRMDILMWKAKFRLL